MIKLLENIIQLRKRFVTPPAGGDGAKKRTEITKMITHQTKKLYAAS